MQIFKILAMAMTGKKGKIKRELVGMTKDLLKNKDQSYFEVFQLLSDLRETDVTSILNECSKLDD